jgi:hypothetical protein
MRVFQAIHKYKPYIPFFEKKYDVANREWTYDSLLELLIRDRFYATHYLLPVMDRSQDGWLTFWDYERLQFLWAAENGLKTTDLKQILLAQLESFKPDVFYNMSPLRFSKEELKELKEKYNSVCWYASPETGDTDFSLFHRTLTNWPTFLDIAKKENFTACLFQPSFDPQMEQVAKNEKRPIDLLFYGQYQNAFFDTRNNFLDQLLIESSDWEIKCHFALQYKEVWKPYVNLPLLNRFHRRVFPPEHVLRKESPPVYGMSMYEMIGQSKVVFNAAVDFTGQYKVNMRNFEALGCGAMMISDEGIYPEGFRPGTDFLTYKSFDGFKEILFDVLENEEKRRSIAATGHAMIKEQFSKERQWQSFQEIVASI